MMLAAFLFGATSVGALCCGYIIVLHRKVKQIRDGWLETRLRLQRGGGR